MRPLQPRIDLIDDLKAIAMQFIVLHHLARYGPLADAAQALLPDIINWFNNYGRIAVQVFLVIGGYLAARALSPQGMPLQGNPFAIILNRYTRLALPYSFALLLAVGCAAFARRWIDDKLFISAAPSLGQLLAHLFFLQDQLGYESLSTGVWYVAIDFQLFFVFVVLLRLSAAGGPIARALALSSVLLLSLTSLFWFNRNDEFDIWALYFFGAYGLGVLTYWAKEGVIGAKFCQRLLWLAVAVVLIVDFRWRLVLAFGAALMLAFAGKSFSLPPGRIQKNLATLGRVSYAHFLVHFPIYMLVSALFIKYELLASYWSGFLGIVLTWVFSVIGAVLLHRWIEKPANKIRLVGAI